jgi:hypothetical protein
MQSPSFHFDFFPQFVFCEDFAHINEKWNKKVFFSKKWNKLPIKMWNLIKIKASFSLYIVNSILSAVRFAKIKIELYWWQIRFIYIANFYFMHIKIKFLLIFLRDMSQDQIMRHFLVYIIAIHNGSSRCEQKLSTINFFLLLTSMQFDICLK